MKKSVIILIGVIYFAAIAIVSFFGLMPETYVTDEKVESISITGDKIKINHEKNTKYAIVRQNDDGEWVYQLEYTITPNNATNANVDFVYEKDDSVTVSDTGLVTFTEPDCAIIIKIMATDGSGISDTITLYSR
jgi:endo-alpha-1,4-polygalactosaminidase (GH114 family)